MTRLVPCTDCARHFRGDEACCPFCGGAPSVLQGRIEERPMPAERALTRAAVMFMGATALAACGKSEMIAPAYGPPPFAPAADGGTVTTTPPQPNPQQMAPAYGPPPIAPTAATPMPEKKP